ncbi:hypothetical protein A3D03_00180 [Candidatus Gottesmanbacteria bacterium RIFCSPHIGHO2_02_FULL_40_13]|uniref:Uncharacterized protein n=1 Tax=Candidatus Gottesmanbacteria bacterium RIFCSPHIGHO2_02_FULL_40_13 TaxID=1798384 RepID=A0A1F6ADA7_9BACT|nr:MAG: hypothetical protein A3D03_00180 [Candidatus Gottesmanbacteria bacterium RIFCSPHIGHO2_02_FULL_40_13]
MNVDLKKLIRVCDFTPEQKKKFIDNLDSFPPEGRLEVWDLCLENLLWKVEIEVSKRFHEGVLNGVIKKQDNNDYSKLEKDVLLDLFTKAEVDARDEEIILIHDVLKKYKDKKPKTSSSIN